MINECQYICFSEYSLFLNCLLPEIYFILVSNQIRDWDLFSPSVIGYHNRVRGINPCSRDEMRPLIGWYHAKWLTSIAIVFPVVLILAVLILVVLKHGWSWRRWLPPFKNLSSLRYAIRQIKLAEIQLNDSLLWLSVLNEKYHDLCLSLEVHRSSMFSRYSVVLTYHFFFSCKLT